MSSNGKELFISLSANLPNQLLNMEPANGEEDGPTLSVQRLGPCLSWKWRQTQKWSARCRKGTGGRGGL